MKNIIYSQNPYFKIVDFFSQHLFERISLHKLKGFLQSVQIDYKQFQREFIDKGLAVVVEENIYLNFHNKFISTLKIARDQYLIESLDIPTRNEVVLIHQEICKHTKDNILATILIGSAARRKMIPSSDLDFCVIAKGGFRGDLNNYVRKVQIKSYTKTGFEKAFDDRDELTLWVLKYGLIMHDNNFIFRFYISSDLTVGEKAILQKRQMIQRLIQDISDSKNSTDERLKYKLRRLIFQMARYILLIYKQLPLSRAELPDQLSKYAPELSQKIMEFEDQDDLTREKLLKYFYEIKKTYNQQLRNI